MSADLVMKKESPHYFSLKGAVAEKVIHDLATKTFLEDWCYPNPKKPDGKELCDLLVVFDDTAVIWQIKDLKVDDQGKYKESDVEKNLRQLSGARRTLFDLRTPIKLTNPRRGDEIFDPDAVKNVHLISVLMGDGWAPFPFIEEVKSRLIHVFTRDFADLALSELDTVSDFCEYLREKEVMATQKRRIMVDGGEENLLGKYLHAGRSFEWMEGFDVIHIDDTIWAAIVRKPEFQAKKRLDAVSYGWDQLINRAHEGSHKYERLARELARPNRFTRRVLSETLLEAYTEFMGSKMDMMRRMTTLADTTYCFLISNDAEHPSARRQNMLQMMCFVARGIRQDCSRVLGVATNRGNTNYDFCFVEKPKWTSEDEVTKNQIQARYGIFVNPRTSVTSADEYPT